ncbi:type II secretion system (T2SS) protein K [Roseateles toxinivorans]|uniref:Type II secretion system (T2SS) protein K n=1 Tax=Roseateles toxinivorans TaxID=270368 RepID=A0A4R6QQA3_9BURK|nr:type II secretion system (T2SS) protein K [Roseateles toxinivorans]
MPRPRLPQRGFVLPVTVVLLALVAVGVALISQRSDEMRSLVSLSLEEQRASTATDRAVAHAIYISSSMYRRGDTLGNIRLDGRFYRTADGVFVRYHDAGALFNLRNSSRDDFARLLLASGVSDASLTDRLTDQLADYVDADHLQHLNGAEAPEYLSAKLPEPRNAKLLSPMELARLPAWNELSSTQRSALLEYAYVGPSRVVNRYTVQAPVLSAIAQLDLQAAKDLVAQRLPGTLLKIESLPIIAGGSYLAESRFISVPSPTLLLTICPPTVAWCQRLSITSSGETAHAPWHIAYSYRFAREAALPAPSSVELLPEDAPAKPPPLYSPFGNLP